MVMSNFIDETERYTELYCKYTDRQIQILQKLACITRKSYRGDEIRVLLLKEGITDSEIHWLKRTGHYLPAYIRKDEENITRIKT